MPPSEAKSRLFRCQTWPANGTIITLESMDTARLARCVEEMTARRRRHRLPFDAVFRQAGYDAPRLTTWAGLSCLSDLTVRSENSREWIELIGMRRIAGLR